MDNIKLLEGFLSDKNKAQAAANVNAALEMIKLKADLLAGGISPKDADQYIVWLIAGVALANQTGGQQT